MFEVTVLSTKDKEQWLEILSRFDRKDPHYLPGYLEIYEKESKESDTFIHFGGQGTLFIYGNSRNFIIYPFFKRSLSHLPFSENSEKKLYDIISPYGYGGPLAQIEDGTVGEELWRGLFNEFDDFCKESNIVSEFCRLHPIFENHKPVGEFSQGIIQQIGQIVYVDLGCSEEEIFTAMAKHHRRRARRASENQDLRFCVDEKDYHPHFFYKIYQDTMQRIGAHNKYFFSQGFFDAVFQTLGENTSFPHVHYKDNIISGWLLLQYGELVYSLVSGCKREYFHLFPDNFLMYSSFLQAKKDGFMYFILGGGLSAKQDSLFAFKAGFSKLRKDYYVYKRIHLKKEYDRLVELQGQGYKGGMPEDFFPQYRLYEAVSREYQAPQGIEG